ncbi:tkl protein kinase [Plasmopara halstedii]|uniref:Tkl protein kinase n=1 Tax=Plasmopara halstedii TaxID=4781 RepID=A0A0P1AZZ9_PLAHL|nr:tkl protein kinase [Plasmopara halstedii]CEG48061.1 tkl protein kinase [Plasmopara halstedii]|eukprot:XP_024584430.1 tkl protein kinase [Plasmopara halstedii]
MHPTERSFLCAVGLLSAVAVQDAATQNTINVACERRNATLRVNEMSSSYQCSDVENWTPQPINAGDVMVSVAADILTMELQSSSAATLNFVAINGISTLASAHTDSLNFASFHNLKSLTFQGVEFEPSSVKLVVPNTVTDIHLIGAALKDLSLPNHSDGLVKIELNDTSISHFPKFLYERRLNPNMNIVVDLSTVTTTTVLNARESVNLNANAKTLSSQDWARQLTSSCSTQSLFNSIRVTRKNGTTVFLCTPQYSSATDDVVLEDVYSAPSGINDSDTSSSSSDDASSGISTGALIAIIATVFVFVVILAFICLRMYFKRNVENANAHGNEATATLMSKGDTATEKGSFLSNDELLRNFWLPQSDVALVKSQGNGRLYAGEYNGSKVMIKRIESEVTDSRVTKALMAQARTFATIAHPNISNLVGVTWLAGTDFAVVTEFMDMGTLKAVLANVTVNLDMTTKLNMCYDIATALAYLHESAQNFCVKRLSSRKVLVNKAYKCKLNLYDCVHSSAKFGGPNAAATYSYGMGELVWLSPEIITRSSPMDARSNNIYAFGVLVCEILTRVTPYRSLIENLGNTKSDIELVERIRRQEALIPHENRQEFITAPASVRQMVEQCLSYAPMSRPTAKDLVDVLRDAKAELSTNNI